MAFSISHNKHKNENKTSHMELANIERKNLRARNRYATFMKHTHTICGAYASIFLLLPFTAQHEIKRLDQCCLVFLS